jgi:O-antigen ligase
VVNGMLLGVEAIIQRLSGSSKLLFMVEPRIHKAAEAQFGSYAYRANAAQYFNLLWPVCVGFWWSLNSASARKHKGRHLLLVAAIVMAACPIISTSRGGAMIAVGSLTLGFVLLSVSNLFVGERRKQDRPWRRPRIVALLVFVIAVLGLGFGFGWKALKPRMAQISEGLAGREELYAAARPMARDYSLFGTGPGTFETVSQLYPHPDIYWPAQLHNDWLETLITFGWVGSVLIGLAFLTILTRWFIVGGIYGGRRFMLLLWLAMAGCLLHARFDFPFQVHSVLFLFVVLCAVAFSLTNRS